MKMLTLSQMSMTTQGASKREKKMGSGVSLKKSVLSKLDRKSIDLNSSIKVTLLKIFMLAKRECLSIDIHFKLSRILRYLRYNFLVTKLRMLPNYEAGNTYTISSLGMEKVLENKKNSKYPGQHVIWTDDKRVELPIRVGKEGVAALPPTTIIEAWQENLQKYSKFPALSHKENNKWVTRTYEEYYE